MIIDGKAIAAQVKASLQGSDAKLAVIMVGDNPASSVYVRNKERACAEVGIRSCSRRLPATASTKEVIASIAGRGRTVFSFSFLSRNTLTRRRYSAQYRRRKTWIASTPIILESS